MLVHNKIRDNIETIIYNNYGFYPDKYLDIDEITYEKLESMSKGQPVTLTKSDIASLDILIDEEYSDSTYYIDKIYAPLRDVIFEYKWDKFKYKFNQAYKIKEESLFILNIITKKVDSKTAKDLVETGNVVQLATLV